MVKKEFEVEANITLGNETSPAVFHINDESLEEAIKIVKEHKKFLGLDAIEVVGAGQSHLPPEG
jgi:hypothetical protein